MTHLRTYEIQTFRRIYDVTAEDRASALSIHESLHPGEVVIDAKDKTAKRAHERKREESNR